MSKNDNIKDKSKDTSEKSEIFSSNTNLFVMGVIIVIIITFVVSGGSILGINQIINDFGKEKIINDNGTISIPADAETGENQNNPDVYVGKVLGQKIRIGKEGEFRNRILGILQYQGMNPMQKLNYARMAFDQEINKIITMHNAKKMDIEITSDSNRLIKEIGKRYFADEDGDVNFYEMRKKSTEVNQRVEEVRKELLLQDFRTDYFEHLPVSNDEMWDNYKIENTKVTIDYINISNSDVDKEVVEQYLNDNVDSYIQCKLSRIVFNTKEDADAALTKILADESKFFDMGNQLKDEGKVINIVYDSGMTFINEFEETAFQDELKITEKNSVGKKVIETSLGPIIFHVTDKAPASIDDDAAFNKIKNDYIEENTTAIEDANKQKANDIHAYAADNGMEAIEGQFGTAPTTSSPATFKGYFPHLNLDETDDLNYMIEIFKANDGDLLPVHKHKAGYLVVSLKEKTQASKEKFENMIDDLTKRYSSTKSRNIETDYFENEKKKYKIVDNFNYVFNYQMFMPPQQTQQ